MKIKLIENWRQSWKMFSVQAMALAAVLQWLQAFYTDLPPELVALIPQAWLPKITVTVLIFGLLGRLIDQFNTAMMKEDNAAQ